MMQVAAYLTGSPCRVIDYIMETLFSQAKIMMVPTTDGHKQIGFFGQAEYVGVVGIGAYLHSVAPLCMAEMYGAG